MALMVEIEGEVPCVCIGVEGAGFLNGIRMKMNVLGLLGPSFYVEYFLT